MSNSVSTAQQGKRDTTQTPHVPPLPARQQQFQTGTLNLLDEARNVVENSVRQGQELNPMIYQMLGLDPQYEDHSQDIQGAQSEFDAAQKQLSEAQDTQASLNGIPKGKRTPAQRKQLRQIRKQIPQLNKALESSRDALGRLQTMPKTITGFNRLDPANIPKESPFSSANPLNQAQATESQRLNQYLQGGEVDPTLKHQYDSMESALRAKLAQRYGPDFENTSVGQMALQNFSRQKNEAFATWNQQMVEKYNDLAFQGQANLQNLLSNRIAMLREPGQASAAMGANLSNLAGNRISQESLNNQMVLGRAGVTVNSINPVTMGSVAGGVGSALMTPYDAQGHTLGGLAVRGGEKAYGALSNWLGGGGGAAAGGAAAGAGAAETGGMSLAGDYGAEAAGSAAALIP
jgi:hypothetical protein